MSRLLIITRPNHDQTTDYLYHWSRPVIKLARQKSFGVIDLAGSKATGANFTSRVRKTDPSFIFLNGHGDERSVMGQGNSVIIPLGDNEGLLKDRISFVRSCSSAKVLGPRSISAGARSFIGYDEPFVFVYETRASTRPLSDKTAALFLKPSNLVATTLIKGHTSSEADERAKKAFRKNIRELLTSETSKSDSSVLRYLVWDMNHQVCLGDPDASL